jgi:hypothetical protein
MFIFPFGEVYNDVLLFHGQLMIQQIHQEREVLNSSNPMIQNLNNYYILPWATQSDCTSPS